MKFRSRSGKISMFLLACLMIGVAVYLGMSRQASTMGSAGITPEEIETAVRVDYPFLLYTVHKYPEEFGLGERDLEAVQLLSPLRIITPGHKLAELRQGKALNVVHLPLIDETGSIFAVQTILKVEGAVNSTMGIDFAPQLETLRVAGVTQAVVFQDEAGIHALDLAAAADPVGRSLGQAANAEALESIPYAVISLTQPDGRLSLLAKEALIFQKDSLKP